MNLPQKKVLVIAYYFPPSGGVGVQRTLKFVKYLRQFGWEPVVLTVRDADYPAYDESLFSEVPANVKICRTRIFEPYRLYRKFTRRKPGESTDIGALPSDENGKPRLPDRISEWLRAALFVPDARISWYWFAIKSARQLLRTDKIDVIYTSAPPYTTHLIGSKLKQKTGLPWVADFRDSWIGWHSTPRRRPKLARALEHKMEGSVLASADKILTVSNGVREDLLSRHPECRDDRWQLLVNGFDAADFEGLEAGARFEKTTVTYLGSLSGASNPEYLLQALERLQGQDPKLARKICFRLIGRISEQILNRIQSSAVKELFEMIPYMSHQESLNHLLQGHVSLLIIDHALSNRGILTGKLFEYVGAGNPILALVPEGEAADLVRSNKLGWVVPPNDPSAIQATLVKILSRKRWKTSANHTLQTQFERRHQTGELATIFDELSDKD